MNLVLPLDSFVLPYAQYVYLAIGIGMLVGLIFSETLGVMGGGLIVPGYFCFTSSRLFFSIYYFFYRIFNILINKNTIKLYNDFW